ncbi:MAG: nitroreductase family protein [Dysgonomonas sp.]
MTLVNVIKKILPSSLLTKKRYLVNNFNLLVNYYYDYSRYVKHSGTTTQNTKDKLIGKITAHYHVIEKGLSYESMKLKFGFNTVIDLVDLLYKYESKSYDLEDVHYKSAISVVNDYIQKHRTKQVDIKLLENKFNKLVLHNNVDYNSCGGTQVIRKSDILQAIDFDFESFFNSRYSIRDFSSDDVDVKLIEKAIDIAQKYPSVCNRQGARVYLIKNKSLVQEHLNYQNGNRGFKECINKLIIVTVDLSVFENANERNQAYIDGGIYLMGLLLSLHSQGLGSVTLNWSTFKNQDKLYRSYSSISDSEVIISFIGVGNIKDVTKVPKSERKKYLDILTVIDDDK